MSDESAEFIKIYRAPNGNFYAVWGGRPVCTPSGGLRYFDTESEVWASLVERKCVSPVPGNIAA
jgi:hypothetical protein